MYSTDRERWKALVKRDKRADGAYVYGVVTTGIYCRPACSSKLPNRENVRFFDTSQDAERAGFRPCKRCDPGAPGGRTTHHDAVVRACRLIEESEDLPSLTDLANAVGFSPSYFHRLFKKEVGLTPKQYATAVRASRVRASLQTSSNVTEAIYDAGFASSSRFYEQAAGTLGMQPSKYRNGGQDLRIRFAVAQCYLGWVLIAATEEGVCAIDLGDDPKRLEQALRAKFSRAEFVDQDPALMTWVAQVLAFLESPRERLDLPLDIKGTAFQQRVWQALQEIPPGATASYADIAARIDSPKAARAVAQACASNRIAVAIPCHRVVRSDGNLGGYRWGRERKRRLLEREARAQSG
jgi:AraC family transcriptional regulator of adaptative response/methylated-DNA-[protein]-cysteine methyltransferase